mgnify:CR=1 FL=1
MSDTVACYMNGEDRILATSRDINDRKRAEAALQRANEELERRVAERTRETVNIGVLSGDGVVYVDQVAGSRAIVSVNWVGQRTPLHCTSNGKVLLAPGQRIKIPQ